MLHLYEVHALSLGDSLAFILCKSALPVSLQYIISMSALRSVSLFCGWGDDITWKIRHIPRPRLNQSDNRVLLSYQMLSLCDRFREQKRQWPADTADENRQADESWTQIWHPLWDQCTPNLFFLSSLFSLTFLYTICTHVQNLKHTNFTAVFFQLFAFLKFLFVILQLKSSVML